MIGGEKLVDFIYEWGREERGFVLCLELIFFSLPPASLFFLFSPLPLGLSKKDSIFKSPDTVDGKVGVTGLEGGGGGGEGRIEREGRKEKIKGEKIPIQNQYYY